jgi:hypothetical protein
MAPRITLTTHSVVGSSGGAWYIVVMVNDGSSGGIRSSSDSGLKSPVTVSSAKKEQASGKALDPDVSPPALAPIVAEGNA